MIVSRSREGCRSGGPTISTSTGTSRRVNHGIRTLDIISDGDVTKEEINLQYCDENCEPELLGADQRVAIDPPSLLHDIVTVAQDHKVPGGLTSVSSFIPMENQVEHTAIPSHPINRWWVSNTL